MTDLNYRFAFALSFAGPQRTIARQLRDLLVARGFRVFIDEDYEHEMLGLDGMKYLRDIYSRQSRVCIVLISAEYSGRAWTELEREAMQSRELRGEQGALISQVRREWRG